MENNRWMIEIWKYLNREFTLCSMKGTKWEMAHGYKLDFSPAVIV